MEYARGCFKYCSSFSLGVFTNLAILDFYPIFIEAIQNKIQECLSAKC